MPTQAHIDKMVQDLGITGRQDVNQMRVAKTDDGGYVMQVALHGKTGWHNITRSYRTEQEAEKQGASILYNDEVAERVAHTHKVLKDEADSDYLHDSDELRHENIIETASDDRVLVGQDE